jgi:hypothetical protein
MPDTDPMPDPKSPEWPVAWAAKRCCAGTWGQSSIGAFPCSQKAILERMRLTKWRISKEPPDDPHSTPGE